jgi:excisionase family DNA binding protein
MNKAEAAEFLEIGVRSLERYMSQGRIAYTRQRGKTGEVVVFNKLELEHFKEELHQATHQGAIEQSRQESPLNSSQLVTSSQIMAEVGESLLNISEGIDALLVVVKELAVKIPVETKPLLTLAEAQQLSGLSRRYLLQAIKENRLKGQKIGKAWRVKRRDLERFVSKLF